MKHLVLAGLALIASTLAAGAAVDLVEVHDPPAVVVSFADELNTGPVGAADLQAVAAIHEQGDAMLSGHIEDATRVIGKSQGYHGLAIKDVQINCTVNGDGTPAMVTAWQPTPDELAALNNGASVHVMLLGQHHPPIMVSVGAEPDAV